MRLVLTAWDTPGSAYRRWRYWCLLVLIGWAGTTLGVAYATPGG